MSHSILRHVEHRMVAEVIPNQSGNGLVDHYTQGVKVRLKLILNAAAPCVEAGQYTAECAPNPSLPPGPGKYRYRN